jgi:hypothetical protein
MYSKGNIMSNLEQQVLAEQQRLHEISSLTDELDDESAMSLLEWASAQIIELAGDGSQLDARAKQLRRLVGEINVLAGRIEGKSGEQLQQGLGQIHQLASGLRYPVQARFIPALAGQLENQSISDVLVILFAWLENNSLLADVLGGESDDD